MAVVARRDADRARVGRPAVRLARRQARRLERDRDREGPRHRRHRRRPDVARRREQARARKAQPPVEGASLASDAFFPFADGVQAALDAGVRVIIQPGGSKRDDEVIAAVEKAGGTMVFTGRRHFSH